MSRHPMPGAHPRASARGIWIVLLACAALLAGRADVEAQRARPHAVYLEHMGNGGRLSANFERDIVPRAALRVGAGFLPVSLDEGDADHYLFPLMLNYRIGSGDWQEEIGFGALIDYSARGDIPPHREVPGVRVAPTATLGVRFAPATSPILLRAGLTPVTIARELLPSFGASVGIRF